jgi:hydrogenase-1 operon protein HyaE
MSETPLVRLLASGEAARLGADTADAFVVAQGPGLLLFTGDPAQRPEAQDVAVVARELVRQSAGRLRLGVVDLDAEGPLKLRLGVTAVPAVLFLRDGGVVAQVPKIAAWSVYAAAAAALLGPAEGP